MQKDAINWHAEWHICKYRDQLSYELDAPYDGAFIPGNLLLTEGATELLKLLIGDSATAYSAANAQLGVGTSTTAAAANQTDLQAGGVWVGMDATYPQVADNVVTFRSTFDGTTANQAWQEFSVRNGLAANKNLNRKVSDQGTKTAGQVWVLTLTITLS